MARVWTRPARASPTAQTSSGAEAATARRVSSVLGMLGLSVCVQPGPQTVGVADGAAGARAAGAADVLIPVAKNGRTSATEARTRLPRATGGFIGASTVERCETSVPQPAAGVKRGA